MCNIRLQYLHLCHTFHSIPFHYLRACVHTYTILRKYKHLFIRWFCGFARATSKFSKTTAQCAPHMAWSVTAKSPCGCFQLLPSLSFRPWGAPRHSFHDSWLLYMVTLFILLTCVEHCDCDTIFVAKCPPKTRRLWMTLACFQITTVFPTISVCHNLWSYLPSLVPQQRLWSGAQSVRPPVQRHAACRRYWFQSHPPNHQAAHWC